MDYKFVIPLVLQIAVLGGGFLWGVAGIHREIAVIQNDMRHLWNTTSRLERLISNDKRTYFEDKSLEERRSLVPQIR